MIRRLFVIVLVVALAATVYLLSWGPGTDAPTGAGGSPGSGQPDHEAAAAVPESRGAAAGPAAEGAPRRDAAAAADPSGCYRG